jgi:hypothetical protein
MPIVIISVVDPLQIGTDLQICNRRSIPLTYTFGSSLFASVFQDANKKRQFFCLLLFEGTFTSVFKDKKS